MPTKKRKNFNKIITDTIKVTTIILLSVSVLFLSLVFFDGDKRVYYVTNVSAIFSAILLIFVSREKYQIAVKISTLTFICSILCSVGYHILSKYNVIEFLENIDNIKMIIKSTGALGILVYFTITFLQVVILPIPAVITIFVGTVIYGPTIAFVVSAVATFLGSCVCFIIGRFFGKKLLKWLFSEEKARKYAKILGKKGKMPFIIMMLLPFFPDDLICTTAGVTDMSFTFFAISVAITRTLYVFIVSFFGEGNIIPFSGWGIPVWIGIFIAVTLLGIVVNKKINRKQGK